VNTVPELFIQKCNLYKSYIVIEPCLKIVLVRGEWENEVSKVNKFFLVFYIRSPILAVCPVELLKKSPKILMTNFVVNQF
jgi:hypothetical protein